MRPDLDEIRSLLKKRRNKNEFKRRKTIFQK